MFIKRWLEWIWCHLGNIFMFSLVVFFVAVIFFMWGYERAKKDYWGLPQNFYAIKENVEYEITSFATSNCNYVWVKVAGEKKKVMLLNEETLNWLKTAPSNKIKLKEKHIISIDYDTGDAAVLKVKN